ncbi:hypothetical protein [Streptosporangium sp. NPDC000396]|uniref:hypothetical protein n=1 Tax=Streptosporangium sp. NPDC000396 TaxID=3366185 RepID=UPI0036B80E42
MRMKALVLILLVLTVSGCVSPAWSDHDYALKAAESAEAAASSVELARLTVRNEDRLLAPYVKTTLTETAGELGSVNDQFGGVQPPSDASDRLRTSLLDLTTQAEDKVQDLLIEARRDGIKDPVRAAGELEELAGRLRELGERLR